MHSSLKAFGRAVRCAGPLALAISLSAGCSLMPKKPAGPSVAASTGPAANATTNAATSAAAPPVLPDRDAVASLLAYADRVRGLQGAELAQEITRLGDAPLPADQLRLAIAVSQTRQLYDLVRAQELLQRVLTNTGDDARPLQGLARLLAARFAEQRRVEDQLDRQNQQLRDLQRRLDQTQDKLEALKEIERSLSNRPPAAPAPAPNSRPRPPGS
jgi:hypothetical protein